MPNISAPPTSSVRIPSPKPAPIEPSSERMVWDALDRIEKLALETATLGRELIRRIEPVSYPIPDPTSEAEELTPVHPIKMVGKLIDLEFILCRLDVEMRNALDRLEI